MRSNELRMYIIVEVMNMITVKVMNMIDHISFTVNRSSVSNIGHLEKQLHMGSSLLEYLTPLPMLLTLSEHLKSERLVEIKLYNPVRP